MPTRTRKAPEAPSDPTEVKTVPVPVLDTDWAVYDDARGRADDILQGSRFREVFAELNTSIGGLSRLASEKGALRQEFDDVYANLSVPVDTAWASR